MHFEVIPNPEAPRAGDRHDESWTWRDNQTGALALFGFPSKSTALLEAALHEAIGGAAAIATGLKTWFRGERFLVEKDNDSYVVIVTWTHDRPHAEVKAAAEKAAQAAGYDMKAGNYFIEGRHHGLRFCPAVTPYT